MDFTKMLTEEQREEREEQLKKQHEDFMSVSGLKPEVFDAEYFSALDNRGEEDKKWMEQEIKAAEARAREEVMRKYADKHTSNTWAKSEKVLAKEASWNELLKGLE